ncbi:MAG TPA: ribosome small subunit-dependent GTPase A [Steroidobacteraceae bacterium]|nr:ribosome small subunit-dependent GTPase A [Steroidobacteraceae bacterium]
MGIVLASYGRGVLVESGCEVFHCSLKGRKLRIVCGDRVAWTNAPAGGGPAIESVEPRRNLVERIDARGRAEPVAANIDRLAIVAAPAPAPDWFLADRYWAGARLKDLETLLIVNKADLGNGSMRDELSSYRALELPCHEVSALSGEGLEELRATLGTGTAFLVGQSGVGKSSLINALAPEAAAETRELTRDIEGRHTTTTARRYRLGPDSALVDAPGVRDFAPPATLARAAEIGFVEIHRVAADCRFNDCRHLEEPACAVRAAVLAGGIAARRYESYRRLFRLYQKLAP